eukprot:CAMPEP_0119048390 /NCGR_PEP_ID=MMETSP1177-20130426/58663_1 /TAXON_ID=2985 /ORGANISM="Ochromonas sp, Strain CCMP1899" /LENGTH=340 /DNA_ID=CAMNT_0007024201 /DNA_START=464 /DNA_END=1489 /DNA_ORIENTATION=-
MLYGQMTSVLPTLRTGYKGLAATPLTVTNTFITASVLWVNCVEAIVHFNDYLLALGTNKDNTWTNYVVYMKKSHRGKKGGREADENGNGIKPFAINEMTMLAYYKKIHPERFFLFPVVPKYDAYKNSRHTVNVSNYSPGGSEVGPVTGSGIWDPNSWGQYIGGTSGSEGKNKGFSEPTHIAGQAMRMNIDCRPAMLCTNKTMPIRKATDLTTPLSKYSPKPASKASRKLKEGINRNLRGKPPPEEKVSEGGLETPGATPQEEVFRKDREALLKHTLFANGTVTVLYEKKGQNEIDSRGLMKCYTAPHVRCSPSDPWTPLWNLHVHSKQTVLYKSQPCSCA